MPIFRIFYLFWYFDMFSENCAYLSQKDRKKSKMEFWRVQRRPAARCVCRSDRWPTATTALEAVRSGKVVLKSLKTPSDRWDVCSELSRRSRSHWTNLQRPLPKSAKASDNAQRPLAKVQRCMNLIRFSPDFTKISQSFPFFHRIRLTPYIYPLKPLHSETPFTLFVSQF